MKIRYSDYICHHAFDMYGKTGIKTTNIIFQNSVLKSNADEFISLINNCNKEDVVGLMVHRFGHEGYVKLIKAATEVPTMYSAHIRADLISTCLHGWNFNNMIFIYIYSNQ